MCHNHSSYGTKKPEHRIASAPSPFFSPVPRPLFYGRGWVRFHAARTRSPECGTSFAGVLALHLSRRDRNRADLSSDKERLRSGEVRIGSRGGSEKVEAAHPTRLFPLY